MSLEAEFERKKKTDLLPVCTPCCLTVTEDVSFQLDAPAAMPTACCGTPISCQNLIPMEP